MFTEDIVKISNEFTRTSNPLQSRNGHLSVLQVCNLFIFSKFLKDSIFNSQDFSDTDRGFEYQNGEF